MSICKSCQAVCLFILGIALLPVISWSQTGPDPKLIEGAKKEGQLVYYTTMTLDQSKQTVDRFEKKYPFIKVTLFRTGGGPLLNKIFTESRGGRHDWDVVVGRGEMVLPLMERKLLASYRSPEYKIIDDQLVDKEGYWTAYYVNSYVLGWNTKLVKREDVPKTYDALLNPKWKGGLISLDTEAYGMFEGLKGVWGRESPRLFQKTCVSGAGFKARQYRKGAAGRGRRISFNHCLQSDHSENDFPRGAG
jgi:spermidine/putrescine-binding protein